MDYLLQIYFELLSSRKSQNLEENVVEKRIFIRFMELPLMCINLRKKLSKNNRNTVVQSNCD